MAKICVCQLLGTKNRPGPRPKCTNPVPEIGYYADGQYCIDCIKGHHKHDKEK